MTDFDDILVLGAGNFGTCLAQHLTYLNKKVFLWAREQTICQSINDSHINPKYLSSITLSDNLIANSNLADLLKNTTGPVVFSIPVQAFSQVLQTIDRRLLQNRLIICASKGIDIKTLKLPMQTILDFVGTSNKANIVMLSGPSFAIEVAQKMPSAVVAAGSDIESVAAVQKLFHTPFFRVYSSLDPIGLEVAGAMKNVIAIAAGACSGLGLADNSHAALVTRGLAEMMRLGAKFGADPITFSGLGGVGDLFLTCSSRKSRNFQVGFGLGQGLSKDQVLKSIGSVAEGVPTTKAAHMLSKKLNIELPITQQVYEVLYENKPIKQALHDLINRDAKAEIYI